MDMMMPKMDGLTACHVISNDPATKSIPVIMVTAINLLMSPITFSELNQQILESQKLMRYAGEGKITALVTNTLEGRKAQPVLATYLIKKKKNPRLNWGAFIAPYEDLETLLLHLGLCVENERYTEVRKHPYYNRVWQTIRRVRGPRIPDNVISHDADNLVLIHALREKYPDNPLLGPSVWLLTRDQSLKTDEKILSSIYKIEHCRLLEEWGKILLPYQNLNGFVFSDYISYLVASELGALIQIPTLNFNVLDIICDPQLSLDDFFSLPVELQIKVIAGMQTDNIIRDLQADAAAASTVEEKTKVTDDFRKKELEILAEEKTRIATQMTQLSQQMLELRQQLAKLGSSSEEKDKTIEEIRKKLQVTEEQLNSYENMTVWQKLKKLFDQTK
jgi:CheY-like chemotaxis protein